MEAGVLVRGCGYRCGWAEVEGGLRQWGHGLSRARLQHKHKMSRIKWPMTACYPRYIFCSENETGCEIKVCFSLGCPRKRMKCLSWVATLTLAVNVINTDIHMDISSVSTLHFSCVTCTDACDCFPNLSTVSCDGPELAVSCCVLPLNRRFTAGWS